MAYSSSGSRPGARPAQPADFARAREEIRHELEKKASREAAFAFVAELRKSAKIVEMPENIRDNPDYVPAGE